MLYILKIKSSKIVYKFIFKSKVIVKFLEVDSLIMFAWTLAEVFELLNFVYRNMW
jgi:hypothetical protein